MVAANGFGLLVLCAHEYQPRAEKFPGVEVIHCPFVDDPTTGATSAQLGRIFDTARTLGMVSKGMSRVSGNILVTCHAGRNRSGLVCALGLSEASGAQPALFIQRIKTKRRGALTNPMFLDLLRRTRRI